MSSSTTQWLSRLFQRPWIILSVLALLVALLATQIPRLALDASADSLVLEGDEALELYRQVNKRYQADSFLLVTYTADGDLYSTPVLERLAQLQDELATVDGVASVVTVLDVPLLYSPPVTLSRLADEVRYLGQPGVDRGLAAREFQNSPLYRNLLTSDDATTTALQVNLRRDERFFELLNRRDALREIQQRGGLSTDQRDALKQAEAAFSEYTVIANERQQQLIDAVRAVLDRHRGPAVIYLGGVPMIAADMISFIENDLMIFGSAMVLFIVLLMALIFRRLRWVSVPLLTCLMTATAMLGLIAWLQWHLTVISSNFVALLLIITLSISIHLVVRFREMQADSPELSQRGLMLNTLVFMAKPCFYTAITTIVAFASLVVSGIRPVIDFGWMMTIGVALALLMAFTVLPASLMLLTKEPPLAQTRRRPLTLYFARCTDHYGGWVLAISALLLLLSLVGISRLQVENRFIDYFHPDTEIYQGMEVIDRQLGGTIPLDIIISAPQRQPANAAAVPAATDATAVDPFADPFTDTSPAPASRTEMPSEAGAGAQPMAEIDPFADPFAEPSADPFAAPGPAATGQATPLGYWYSRAGLEELAQVHRFLEAQDETGKVLSLASLYQVLKDIAGADIDDLQLALLGKNLPNDIRRLLIAPYLSDDGTETRLTVRVKETSRSLRREQLLNRIDQFLTQQMGYTTQQHQLTGMLVLYNNMLQSLFGSQIKTLGAVFVIITLMFTVLFRSLSLAIIAITPNLLAAGLVLGGMGWVGIPLDMMTITIAAITVGIGVDDTIHYIHRFKKEFPRDRDYRATMYRCHASIGRAMFYTSVIIITGFSILVLSNFTPTIYFGLLTGLAMLSALLGALLLLPQLIICFKPLGRELSSS